MIDEEHMYNEKKRILYCLVTLEYISSFYYFIYFLAQFTIKLLTFQELNPEIILYITQYITMWGGERTYLYKGVIVVREEV